MLASFKKFSIQQAKPKRIKLVGKKSSCWNGVFATGRPVPTGRYGHSVIYHPSTSRLFVFGGSNQVEFSNELHVLDWEKKEWAVLQSGTEGEGDEKGVISRRHFFFIFFFVATNFFFIFFFCSKGYLGGSESKGEQQRSDKEVQPHGRCMGE